MLRVAHVLNSPGTGGVPRVVDALVRHATPDRIAPHVFYLKGGTGSDLLEDLDIPRRAAASASKASAMTELVSFLDRHSIDILHTHSFRPNLYARMAGAVLRPSGLKIIAHYHNDYTDKWDADAVCLERRLAAITDQGIAVSTAVAGHVAERVGLVCEVATNGIDHARVIGGDRQAGRAVCGADPSDIVIGLIGRVCHQKGVDTFVDAALALASDRPNLRFVVIGEREDAALATRLSAEICAQNLSDRIRFLGHREDMADMFAALDLLVAPSRWEGFGLMLAEAMAAGVPVIASTVGGIPEVVGSAGQFVPPDDPAAIADTVRFLLDNPDQRAAQIAQGRSCAKRYDWARTSARLGQLYDHVARSA